jgi:hypothetical protein
MPAALEQEKLVEGFEDVDTGLVDTVEASRIGSDNNFDINLWDDVNLSAVRHSAERTFKER